MYKRLLSLVNNFVHVERAHLGQTIHCQLLNVTPETIEIQTYDKDGKEDTRWILPMGSVTGVATQSADIDRLALTVKYAQSPDDRLSDEKASSSVGSDA
jgi:sugar lactone lactonase YvrE